MESRKQGVWYLPKLWCSAFHLSDAHRKKPIICVCTTFDFNIFKHPLTNDYSITKLLRDIVAVCTFFITFTTPFLLAWFCISLSTTLDLSGLLRGQFLKQQFDADIMMSIQIINTNLKIIFSNETIACEVGYHGNWH